MGEGAVHVITHVAIIFKGVTYSLPSPNRHHHIIRHICETTDADHVDSSQEGDGQGFLDDQGRYMTRRQALMHALKCNQVKDPAKIRAGRLFSEDLW